MIDNSDIRNKNFRLAIVGMGRIGLPLAISFARKGVRVVGVEKQEKILEKLNSGYTPFYEPEMESGLIECVKSGRLTFEFDSNFKFGECNINVVAIGTPLKENLLPDMSSILKVVSKIADSASDNSIIILRSTLVPGITESQILPRVKRSKSNLKLAVCPERVVEGNAMKEIAELPEIVGVNDRRVGDLVRELFLLLGPKDISITQIRVAEAVKIFTNVYRYVSFALANEFALISEKLSIDSAEAINLANKGYPRSRIPLPGPAAGPCLRKDGLFLSNLSAVNLTKVAWLLNEHLPSHIIETIERAYGSLCDRKVGVLGKTYKANVDDTRDSPALRLIAELETKGSTVLTFDPYTQNDYTLKEVLESEVVILAVNHSYFEKITASMLKGSKLVYDAWGLFSKLCLEKHDVTYMSLGNGALPNRVRNSLPGEPLKTVQ
jgi:UDP-N-acetyl-D-mannosaminuronic acid dehydrogenase